MGAVIFIVTSLTHALNIKVVLAVATSIAYLLLHCVYIFLVDLLFGYPSCDGRLIRSQMEAISQNRTK